MTLPDSASIEIRWGARIPMRDGVQLSATVYKPKDWNAPLACVLAMTPYTSDIYHGDAVYFAAHGLAFVVADVRGRGNSDGTFQPYVNDAQDGFDVVEWLARQPYCSGKIAMFGGSYSGYTQWATAGESPSPLVTIVPIAATFAGVHAPMRNNIFYPERLRWLALISGRTHRGRIHADGTFWSTISARWHESGRPFRDLDAVAELPSSTFQEWLAHPEPDAYWDARNPRAAHYQRLSIPILTVTGCYDVDQPGALEHYKQHVRNATPEGRSKHFLVIGPWDHSGAQLPRAQFGGLTCGPASVIDMRKLHLEWYAWTMECGSKPEFLKKNVTYYVTGAECWRYASSLEEVTERYERLFLDSRSNANDAFRAGLLSSEQGSGNADFFIYDPRDSHGLEVHAALHSDDQSLFDQSLTQALRGRQLVYQTAPLAQAVEVSGFFRLSAWISIDCPDTDFYVSIYEVSATGSVLILSTDVMRARYRTGLRNPQRVRTTEPLCYEFNSFTFVSRRIDRGSRLRLVIAPFGRIDSKFVQKNYNGGGVVADESIEHARAVTVKLFHDAARPSALYVPIGGEASANVSPG